MRAFWLIPAFALLAACGSEQTKRATFTCPNGPDLVVLYNEGSASIVFPDGRVETLPATEDATIYAKPGTVWHTFAFRTARLTDGEKSYRCDQMAG